MTKSEGKKLADAIDALGIKKAHFALFVRRTTVMMSAYLNDRQPIPYWVWDKVEEARKLPKKALKAKIDALRAETKEKAA